MIAPQFVDTGYEAIVARMVARYEEIVGRTVQPAQVERLVINNIAYEIKVALEQMQSASEQQLLAFATAPMLDFLAELVGVDRLPASGAVTTLQFTAVVGATSAVVPANTRVGSVDGRVIFLTTEAVTLAGSPLTGTVGAISTTVGANGNGYLPGEVSQVLDPQPFIATVANTETTNGGANAESDDELRERTRLAPAQYSVAGPSEAYKFFARKASSAIIDVAVMSPAPGTVNVYPLISGGVGTPQTLLDLVNATLNDDRVRPLTDTVAVISPTVVPFVVNIQITAYTNADEATIVSGATSAVAAYLLARENRLGQDVKRSQLIHLATTSVSEVFDVNVVEPAADVVVNLSEVPKATALTITVTNRSDG
jgi:phage-related baseplate assembly protein